MKKFILTIIDTYSITELIANIIGFFAVLFTSIGVGLSCNNLGAFFVIYGFGLTLHLICLVLTHS